MNGSEVPALVAVVVRAPDGIRCDGLDCTAPAVVTISADMWRRSLNRCADHWPDLREMLTRRGHTVNLR